MNSAGDDPARSLRRATYCLLAVISLASISGRIFAVQSELGGTPLLGANDRSRWSTVRSLVDHGTYAIDDVILPGGRRDREWYTIDMVRHRGADGREHYYSSKPPLLATLVAAKYWLLKQISGVTFSEHPFYVGRLLLVSTNLLPLALYFFCTAVLVERYGKTDWGRILVFAAATWGTFLTTFAVTLNNHLPAAISTLLAVYASLRILEQRKGGYFDFVLAGGCAAFAVTNELPALSFFCCLAAWLMLYAPRRTLLGFAPAAATVCALFFVCNFAAHQSWRVPYAHRQDGPVVAIASIDALPDRNGEDPVPVPAALRQDLPFELAASATLIPAADPGRWILWDEQQQQRWAVVAANRVEIRAWDNWYDYDGSYWTDERRRGVDRGEASRAVYAFHAIVGHRGILSLTPIWLLSIAGLGVWLVGQDRQLQMYSAMVILLTATCLTFYLTRGLIDRNYGGVAAGLRWTFWFTPLWLLAMLPAVDRIGKHRWGRIAAYALLSISIFSAVYPAENPWSHSWIFDYWTRLGWIKY